MREVLGRQLLEHVGSSGEANELCVVRVVAVELLFDGDDVAVDSGWA